MIHPIFRATQFVQQLPLPRLTALFVGIAIVAVIVMHVINRQRRK
jgi:hypothetical protein